MNEAAPSREHRTLSYREPIVGPAFYAPGAAAGARASRAAGPLGASLLYLALGGYRPVFWTLAGALVVVGAVVAVAAREARAPAAAPGA